MSRSIRVFKKNVNVCYHFNSILIIFFQAFMLLIIIQYLGLICLANTKDKLQEGDFRIPSKKFYFQHKAVQTQTSFINIMNKESLIIGSKNIKLAVAVIENRFVAKGIITDIKRASEGIQKFAMHINKIEQVDDYPNFGGNYLGKEVEILSEIGIPSFFQIGVGISVVLRVSGDELGQYLFLVEVIQNEPKN